MTSPEVAPAKKAAAPGPKKKAAPRKRAAKVTPATEPVQVAIFMVGASRGHKHGDRVMVDPAVATSLVANGLAR